MPGRQRDRWKVVVGGKDTGFGTPPLCNVDTLACGVLAQPLGHPNVYLLNSLQRDVLRGTEGMAPVSTKIISISALLSAPNTFYDWAPRHGPFRCLSFCQIKGMPEKLLGLQGLPGGNGIRQKPAVAGDGLKISWFFLLSTRATTGCREDRDFHKGTRVMPWDLTEVLHWDNVRTTASNKRGAAFILNTAAHIQEISCSQVLYG